VLINIFF